MTMVASNADACAHCGLPTGGTSQFCCAGCEAVWHALHSCGLQRYYHMQRAAGESPNRPAPHRTYAYLDHPDFQSRHVMRGASGQRHVELRVDGIKCGACLWLLEALPRLLQGVVRARVDVGRSVIALEWDGERVELSSIAAGIAGLGYQVWPLGARAAREQWRQQDRRWLVDIGVAGAVAGNVMAIAFALYGAQFSWMDPVTRQFLQWVSAALAATAVLWPGRLYLRNAWVALRTRVPHMDVPIALALLAGLLGGAAMTAAGKPGVYFESVSMLVFLLLVGRFVQFRQHRRARHEVELICALVPQTAWRLRADGQLDEVPTESLRPGDCVNVPPGEAAPADGVLRSDQAHVDMQLLTGEAWPVRVLRGERVEAGVRTLNAAMQLQVTASGEATRAASIARMVEAAAGQRPPIVEFANRIAGWFVVVVVAITVATGAVWAFIDPARAPSVMVAMLVVTCPCALGLATPLTMVASLGKAARAGMLVRNGEVLERLARTGTLVLDKTGTVTEGAVAVLRVHGERGAVQLAAHLERHSTHPAAAAIARLCDGAAARPLDVRDVRQEPGAGIEGVVDGHRVAVGTRGFVERRGVGDTPATLAHAADACVAAGLSPVFISVDGTACAVVGVGDPLRTDAKASVEQVKARGWDVWLLSGDVSQLAKAIGAAVGVPANHVRGECSPEEKLGLVRCMGRTPVVMVGDGLNDLPAMAAAEVGVAVKQGAQATVARADVALTSGGLGGVVSLLDGARRTMRTVHVNFAISLAYNAVGGVLAATGMISPLIAAIMMPLSAIMVTAVALRMPRFRAAMPEGVP